MVTALAKKFPEDMKRKGDKGVTLFATLRELTRRQVTSYILNGPIVLKLAAIPPESCLFGQATSHERIAISSGLGPFLEGKE